MCCTSWLRQSRAGLAWHPRGAWSSAPSVSEHPCDGCQPGRQKLVDRAKLLLSTDLALRWTLAELTTGVGVSPVYLAQVASSFTIRCNSKPGTSRRLSSCASRKTSLWHTRTSSASILVRNRTLSGTTKRGKLDRTAWSSGRLNRARPLATLNLG